MAEHGPGAILQSLEVLVTSVGPDTSMRAPLGLQYINTSPKTIEDFMRKKYPVLLWQNRVLVQHCSPWRCQLLVSAPTLV
jgi:hypothetical protein